jgi:putative endopeptidase
MSLKSEPEKIDGFTGDQRFFLGFAQSECMAMRDELMRKQVLTDEHSPKKFRVNGPAFNMPEFF